MYSEHASVEFKSGASVCRIQIRLGKQKAGGCLKNLFLTRMTMAIKSCTRVLSFKMVNAKEKLKYVLSVPEWIQFKLWRKLL